jgi:hypothetical protein
MKNGLFLIIGVLVIFGFMGCSSGDDNADTGTGNGKTLTFKLIPGAMNTFTITVAGGKWPTNVSWYEEDLETDYGTRPHCLCRVLQPNPGAPDAVYMNGAVSRMSDSVLSITLVGGYANTGGTIKINPDKIQTLGYICTGNWEEDSEYKYVLANDSGTAAWGFY